MDVVHLSTADEMLTVTGDALRRTGAEGELTLGILWRLTHEPDAWGADVTLLAGVEGGTPVAVVTMTGPHPALIVGLGDDPGVDYAGFVEAMAEGPRPVGVNGAVRWVDPFARAWSEAGASTTLHRKMRAFELLAVKPPRTPDGTFRPAGPADGELMERWVIAFGEDIAEQVTAEQAHNTVYRLTTTGDLWVWERDGEVVSMAAITRRTPWSSTVALVYTPPQQRGQGYASAVVAQLSQRELDAGQEWCALFTDVANPTSNHIYAEIGYEPRCDFHHYVLDW